MGYRADGKLEHFGRPELMVAAAIRTVDRVDDRMLELTKEHTPIAKPPPGLSAEDFAWWLRSRHGRAPGSLRESWRVGEIEVIDGGKLVRKDVYTNDPIAPYVEYPTLPHIIIPRRPGGLLHFFNEHGGSVYAVIVHHTGTKGSFMLTTAQAEIAVSWQEIGAEEMRRWARDAARAVHA
jgi:hypothetical protein